MKKTTTSIIVLTLILITLLAACGSSYKTDVPVADVSAAVQSALAGDNDFADAPDSYITGYMKLDVATVSDYAVKINSRGVNIDEYGIFKAADDAQLKELQTMVEEYFKYRREIWMTEYMPEELPKLENAEVKVVGNYVMYAILSDSDKAAAFSALEDALKA